MHKTLILAAVATLAGLAATAPGQAATRQVDLGPGTFAQRCLAQGGLFGHADPVFSCQTGPVLVECGFVGPNSAECRWPGVDNQVAVNRLIGTPDADSITTLNGPAAKKGGVKLPDLPIKWW
jgi:hypothetical protein